ncbi:hypothetical protein FIBSPDRAFT_1054264 [Athelia psychrophila]|uniref:Uncharacterized protein n=1 Tax=Athelia psychrophila TaxID=1759441 RepID=A0A167VLH9_9AGAM|nr:hypothetical protein FIBSPDRAFT_1054264 [Fibularhizoctonia sp. CBS 109695]
MEVEYSDFANNGLSNLKATADDEHSLDANATSLPPLSELQTRSKLPLSMIASPIMENWDSAALAHSSRETNTTHSCSEDAESGYELDEDDMHFGTESVTSAESQSGLPLPVTRSVSPDPTLGFKSLSPPPWHFRARRQNAWRYANLNVAAETEAEDEQGDVFSDGRSLCQLFEQPAVSD